MPPLTPPGNDEPENIPPSAAERMQQMLEAHANRGPAAHDPDEELFAEAFPADAGGGIWDDEGEFDVDAAPLPEPIYQAPLPLEVAAAADLDADGLAPVAQDAWRSLLSLPGYSDRGAAGQAIRTLGRGIFRTLPCFTRMEQECRAAGRDPLGEVQVMADIGGQGPSSRTQLDAMEAWVRANGFDVDSRRIEFPGAFPGYRPLVTLAATDNDSFLMVEERRDRGAFADAVYIYSWRGGRQLYLDNPDAREALQALGGAAGRAPMAVAAGEPTPPAEPAPAADPDAVAAPPAERTGMATLRNAVRAAVNGGPLEPDAPARTDGPARVADRLPPRPSETREAPRTANANPIQILRAAGFSPCGTDDGPGLRRDTPDGGQIVVVGEGRSLALATSFSVRKLDANGTETDRTSCEGAEAAIGWADGTAAPRP